MLHIRLTENFSENQEVVPVASKSSGALTIFSVNLTMKKRILIIDHNQNVSKKR